MCELVGGIPGAHGCCWTLASLPPLFAFGFASAGMLLWGLAAVIPVLIHLWSSRRRETVRWAAMDFLAAALEKQARRIRIEQLVLLAVRVGLILLLALAWADPQWDSLGGLTASVPDPARKHTVLVLDASYSMDCRDGSMSHFELAQKWAEQRVRRARQGDGFTLVLLASPPQVIVPEPTFDTASILDEIQNLRLSHSGAGLEATLVEIDRILEEAAQQHPRLQHHEVCFVTDLGANTWDAVRTPGGRRQVAQIEQRARLILHEVGSSTEENLAITRVDHGQSRVLGGDVVELQVEVRNFGQRQQETTLGLYIDNRQVSEEEITVPGRGTILHNWTHRFDLPGFHVVNARLGDDVLKIDNHRWLSLQVREAIRVLCVEGKPGAAQFVALALAPSDLQQRIQLEVVAESALVERDLFPYDSLFLCNIGRLSATEAGLLRRFTASGGGLITILGDQVQAGSYNEQLGPDSGHRLLPARVGELLRADAVHFVPDYDHPIVSPFEGHERSGLLTVPTWSYFQLLPNQPTAKAALRFENGDPALLSDVVGAGRSVLLATAASTRSMDHGVQPPIPWSALSTSPSFVPLMHEMLSFSIGGQDRQFNGLVGQELTWKGATSGVAETSVVEDPSGATRAISPSMQQGELRWSYAETTRRGVYRVDIGPGSSNKTFAVNVDIAESDLKRLDVELLPSQFESATDQAVQPATPTQFPEESWAFRLFLAAAGLLLLSESCLSCWFSRRFA